MRIVPGLHSVAEALKVRPKAITELWVREGNLNDDLEVLHREAVAHRIKVKRVSQKALDREVASHQGVIAHVSQGPSWPDRKVLEGAVEALIFALDSMSDPNNVGSLARTAWNFGAMGIMSTTDRSAGLSPAAEKVASGGFEHVPFYEVANLGAELKALKDWGFWIYGLDGASGESLVTTQLAPKSVIVIGSEEAGLHKPVAQMCDVLVAIPQALGSDSFNAGVAGAIGGYEFRRQRNLSENLKNSRKKL